MIGRYIALIAWGVVGGFVAMLGVADYQGARGAWLLVAAWATGWSLWEAIDIVRLRAVTPAEADPDDLVVSFVASDSGDVQIEVHDR